MNLNKNTFLLLFVSLVLFSSCSRKKSNVAAGYIPADASAVVAVNAHQLMDKLGKDGITMQKIYGLVFGGPGDTASKPGVFWPGADTSGVDFKEPVYISLNIPSKITDPNAVIRVIVQLKDAKQFAKTIDVLDGEVKKEDKMTLVTTDESALGYTSKTAIYVAHLNADAITGTKTMPMFKLDSLNDAPELPAFTGKMAADIVRASFSLEKKSSLAGNDDFDEMPIGDNDIKIWTNYTTGVAGMLKGDLATAAVVLDPILKSSYTSSVMNFENGAIKGTSKMYFPKEAAEAIKKSAARDMDFSAIAAFPGKELNGYMGVAFDPAMIRHLLEFTKWDGNANMALSLLGLSLDDFLNALTGDISVIFADAGTLAAGGTMSDPLRKSNWAAAVKINNKLSLEKILNNRKVFDSLKKVGTAYVMEKDSARIFFNIKDNYLYIGGNPTLLAQFMDGTKKNDFASGPLARFAKKPFGVYLSAAGLPDSATKNLSVFAITGLRELVVTGQHFEKNYLQSNLEINTANKQQNSLSAAFNAVFSYMQFRMTRMMQEEGIDEDMPPLVPMPVK